MILRGQQGGRDNMQWGLVTEETQKLDKDTAIWGARAILEGGSYSLLSDRQSVGGNPDEVKELIRILNSYALRECHYRATTAITKGTIGHNVEGVIVLFEDDNVKIIGDSRKSHGYLYISAWLKSDREPDVGDYWCLLHDGPMGDKPIPEGYKCMCPKRKN